MRCLSDSALITETTRTTTMAKVKLKATELGAMPLLYLRIWQACGLCPISLASEQDAVKMVNRTRLDKITAKYAFAERPSTQQQQRTKFNLPLIWSIVQMGLLTTLHTYATYNRDQWIFDEDNFGKFNDIVKLVAAITSYTVTIIECIWRRNELVIFLQLYCAVQRSWPGQTAPWPLNQYRRMRIYLAVGLLIMFVTEGIYIWQIRYYRQQWIMYFGGFMPAVTVCRIRFIQYVFYLELLRMSVEHLNDDVCRLQRIAVVNNDDDANVTHHLDVKLQRMVVIYTTIYRMAQVLCSSTAFSLVSIFVTSYIKLLSDCYWSYWVAYNGENINESTLIVSTLVNMTLLMMSSRNCMNSVDVLVHNVHRIRIPVDNLILARRLQNFCLLLRHQPIVYHAYGFFVVDCSLIGTMLTSITTYMIFFVQFMPIFKRI